MIVILEDKKSDIKQSFFYDRVPVGGKFHAFGSPTRFDDNPSHLGRDKRAERMAGLLSFQPEQLVSGHADNYHRCFGVDWNFIELSGLTHGSDWKPETAARVKKFVDYGHSLGYLVSLYAPVGFTPDQNQGWTDEYNFGSLDAAHARWKAALDAHADFIATDQYEEVTKLIREKK